MSRPSIFGFTGAARSGKDTAAAFLQARLGGYRYAFADPLRAMLYAGFGIDMNEPHWKAHKEDAIPAFGVSPRQMMQTLGTEWGRKMVNTDVWLLLAKNQLLQRGPGMIVTDVRFENEAAWVRKMGGVVIHVKRDAAPKVAKHESESGVHVAELSDQILLNDGTLEELQNQIFQLAERWE
jgi:hypothetical protein